MRMFVSKLVALFRRKRLDAQLDDDVRAHLTLLEDEYVRRGMTADDARFAARRAFGGVEQIKEQHRDGRSLLWLDDLRRDVRHAVRILVGSPGYTAVAVATLVVGIGSTTALFTITRDALLRTLPAAHPEELIELGCIEPLGDGRASDGCNTSFAGFEMYRERRDVIAGAFAFAPIEEVTASAHGTTEIVRGMLASGDMSAVLGMKAHVGRLFTAADDRDGAPLTVVLSHSYWKGRFGGDEAAVGQSIRLSGHQATIVGVTPPAFRGLMLGDVPDLTVPLGSADLFLGPGTLASGGNWWLRVIVRRRPDVTIERVKEALEPTFTRTIEHHLASVPPELASRVRDALTQLRFNVTPAAGGVLSEFRHTLDLPLRSLTAVVIIFTLIACANLAGLVTWRATGRHREFSMRLALGATRARVIRQLLTESLLISLVGGVIGLVMAQWVAPALVYLAAGDAGIRALDLRPDFWVFAITAAAATTTGVLAAIGSILRVSQAYPQRTLKTGRGEPNTSFLGGVLVAGQCALTVLLLVGAGLFVGTLANLRVLAPGFAVDDRVIADVAPGLAGYDSDRAAQYIDRAVEALQSVPGVESVTYSADPMGRLGNTTLAEFPGFESAPSSQRMVGRNTVGPRFAETVGLRLLLGRDISASDHLTLARVALVNESFARHFYQTTDVVGRQFRLLGSPEHHTIIGVVSDARDRGVRAPSERVVYEAPFGHAEDGLTFTVRGALDSPGVLPAVAHALQQVDGSVPVRHLRTAADEMEDALRRERLLGILTSLFSAAALLLVAIGLYGILSVIVARRTAEIGIRMALGSTAAGVLWLVLRQTLAFVVAGAVIGLAAASALTRFIQAQLFGVSASDPAILAGATAVLLVVAVGAAMWPARRAATVEPTVALRRE